MKTDREYAKKFEQILARVSLAGLPPVQAEFLREKSLRHRFSFQEFKQLVEIARELNLWDEGGVSDLWPAEAETAVSDRECKKQVLAAIQQRWQALKAAPNRYPADFPRPVAGKLRIVAESQQKLGFGRCPVASPRTRCCNLLTLDAVESCGFDCSYCSIQSFYRGDRIRFDADFGAKLDALEIDPAQIYHIGTGQSSDSLMWGNRYGLLDKLVAFAARHPNVILEFKTKSKNISYFLEHEIPPNIICTWSLNTPVIIEHEERLTVTLEQRLQAARRVADKGILVGFHLHPMVHYDRWREDYARVLQAMLEGFQADEVAMVSLGTLTFTKSVIKTIRNRDFKTKILRMPFEQADGKLSYPQAYKNRMFAHAYESLSAWHAKVFFYLCMENQSLWRPVFGYDYPSNAAFEQAMKTSYMNKIRGLRSKV